MFLHQNLPLSHWGQASREQHFLLYLQPPLWGLHSVWGGGAWQGHFPLQPSWVFTPALPPHQTERLGLVQGWGWGNYPAGLWKGKLGCGGKYACHGVSPILFKP